MADEHGDPAPGCRCPCAVGNEFGERSARSDLDEYRRHGPDRTTAWLIDALRGGPGGSVTGLSVLDIGAGVGAVHLELIQSGAAAAVDVDGSPAYVEAALSEAQRRGVADRVRHVTGDFVEVAPQVDPADLVALDRVVCCYPDMEALVEASVARARRRIGFVYPRDSRWIRFGGRVFNATSRLLRRRLRFYVHPTANVEAIVTAAGFTRSSYRTTLFWQVSVFQRS